MVYREIGESVKNLRQKVRSVDDAEHLARRRLPPALVQRIEGGAGRGVTVAANTAAYDEVEFRPRAGVWSPLPERRLGTTVLGHRVSLPVLTAPITNLRVFHRDGEIGVARAAGDAGTVACISALTGFPIEMVAAAATGVLFFQLYYLGGRDAAEALIERVKRAGVRALLLNLGAPTWMRRERPLRERVPELRRGRRPLLRFAPQALAHPRWAAGFVRDGLPFEAPMALRADGRTMTIAQAQATLAHAPPTWADIGWIRELFDGPVIVKGILSADDARRAVAEGAAAVVVSNHGGNTLDGLPPSLKVLPEVAAAVGDEVEVLVDGGIRRGSDVAKALALGARAVLVGRSYVWAHATAGSDGVAHLLELLRRELDATLVILGCPSVDQLDESYLRLPPSWQGAPFQTHGV